VKPVLTTAEMRAADAAALTQVSHHTLVTRAGTAVATAALRIMGGAYGRRVIVVAGKGSNGADGRVAADVLVRRGARVQVVDAAAAPRRLPACDLVIDGAYGTGFRGSYDAPVVPVGTPALAIDLPSGLNGDTGCASEGRSEPPIPSPLPPPSPGSSRATDRASAVTSTWPTSASTRAPRPPR
jgi:ADP-dependent NAD(P)H-hydrate dehydratase / NAD(P)H-hydrate epimerase